MMRLRLEQGFKNYPESYPKTEVTNGTLPQSRAHFECTFWWESQAVMLLPRHALRGIPHCGAQNPCSKQSHKLGTLSPDYILPIIHTYPDLVCPYAVGAKRDPARSGAR